MDNLEFVKKHSGELNRRAYRNGMHATELFRDCITHLATFYRLQIEGSTEKLLNEYKGATDKYDDETKRYFKELLMDLIKLLSENPHDYLGELYQNIGANKRGLGQFYTPTSVSTLMSQMAINDMDFDTPRDEPCTINDPCCGSGSMLIGAVNVFKEKGVNYAYDTVLYGTDIDKLACYMCYLQLNALGAAAVITHGDSITMESGDIMPTLGAYGQSMLRELYKTNTDDKVAEEKAS